MVKSSGALEEAANPALPRNAEPLSPQLELVAEIRRVLQVADALGVRAVELRSQVPPIMSVREAAQFLGMNEKAIYRAVARREMPGARRIGKIVRISTDALLDWLAKGRGR